jgi:hypothetical protein
LSDFQSELVLDQQRKLAAALKRRKTLSLHDCFDPIDVNSRPTATQRQILDDVDKVQFRYVIAGNQSGKTQTGAREVSWIFSENHPNWKRPERWGNEPLLILVVARTTKQIEENHMA